MKHLLYILLGFIVMLVIYSAGIGIKYLIDNFPLACMGAAIVIVFVFTAWSVGKSISEY